MAKIENISNSNFKMPQEGKNLINKNQSGNFEYLNNEANQYKDFLKDKNNKSHDIPTIVNKFYMNDKNKNLQKKSKENIIVSSNDLKSEISKINNNKNNKKENNLTTSTFMYYKENIFLSKLKSIYRTKQKYISVILLIFGVSLFLLSIFDLFKIIQSGKGDYLLCKLTVFVLEMICTGLIIIFHMIYYFINRADNYIIFVIMSITIFIFSLVYVSIYVRRKIRLFEIILYMIYNLLLALINFIYLFMNNSLIKRKNKDQQNIEDIMNFTINNEKNDNSKGKKIEKDKKTKGVALVEE
jgi:hypothetical protein